MKIFKQLNKKGYKHYYEGTIEELDSMDKDNPHLHSEIMQVIMWLYEKHGIWIWVERYSTLFRPYAEEIGDERFGKWEGHKYNSPTEAYSSAISYTLNNLI